MAWSLTRLTTDWCLIADPGVTSSIPTRSYTFLEIDQKKFYGKSLPFRCLIQERVVVSYNQKYVHEVLVNRLFKLAQEKSVVGELTIL